MDGAPAGDEGMSRFFFSAGQRYGDRVVLDDDAARHLRRVLRYSVGDEIELCDGVGGCFRACLITAGDSVVCLLGERLPGREAAVRCTLAFALLKGEKSELLLQKGTELGVAGFLPFTCRHSVVRPETKKVTSRMDRWQKIVRAAAGQARRDLIPPVSSLHTWPELLTCLTQFKKTIFFFEGEGGVPLAAALRDVFPGDRVLLVTGPEGGFNKAEATEIRALGAATVTLGPRILRAETAAVVAAALALYEAGELGGSA